MCLATSGHLSTTTDRGKLYSRRPGVQCHKPLSAPVSAGRFQWNQNAVKKISLSITTRVKYLYRLGNYEVAAKLLTEMGALAMEHHLQRQLGRALHLLGELHLRREKPELGTQHLAEAFTCFMGLDFSSVCIYFYLY